MPTGLATPSDVEAARRKAAVSTPLGRISAASSPGAGFEPGEVLAERYRIIGLIGRGGMGEVYRADDLKLGQPVALKFLPERLTHDVSFVQRFYAEVRHARQVSHPNVCRVYDVGEIGGRHYLSMEYVDGEDLASLLRRIGRLGHDKALELARQLCAGLAAAHDKGVLHRDLKPANVMIDGRGRARITDFGLAVAADEEHAEGEISGTPAYMAPEQLAGRAATVQSDVYALGLVFYELFTGKRAFEAASVAEWRRKHTEEAPPAPSSAVREMEPIVERVILRCLEKEPRERPRSALAVAAALRGATLLPPPSPRERRLHPRWSPRPGTSAGSNRRTPGCCCAWSCSAWRRRTSLAEGRAAWRVPLEQTADALAERSRADPAIASAIAEKPADTASPVRTQLAITFGTWGRTDRSPDRWQDMSDGRPAGAYLLLYARAPLARARKLFTGAPFNGLVSLHDPPPAVPGMALVIWTRPDGSFGSKSFRRSAPGTPADLPAADWTGLFEEAGLDPAKFAEVPPEWTPPAYAEARKAWLETRPESGRAPLRVEAAVLGGRPTSFEAHRALGTSARHALRRSESPEAAAGNIMVLTIFVGRHPREVC